MGGVFIALLESCSFGWFAGRRKNRITGGTGGLDGAAEGMWADSGPVCAFDHHGEGEPDGSSLPETG